MKITRRRFLAGTGLTIAATATTPSHILESVGVAPAARERLAIRDQFDLSRDYIHLASFYLASHPRQVREAIEKYRRAIDQNPYIVVERGLFDPESENMPLKVQQAAADYLGAKPEEIALTGSTTMGLSLVYNGLRIKAGQEILTTEHDHYSHHESIRLAAQKNGASLKKIPLFDSFDSISEESIVTRIQTAIRPNTRAVGITWVHSSSGLKLPVARIAEMLRAANTKRDESSRILLIVDGVHGLGVEDENVDTLGCDFLVAGTHKWIFGPRGTGIIWAKQQGWSQISPTIPAFDVNYYTFWMENRPPQGPTQARWISPGGFHAFEHQWAVADAFRFHLQIGKRKIADSIHSLNQQCKDGLAKMSHVKLYTPRSTDLSAGLICFDVNGMKPEEVIEKLLQRKIIASVTPYGAAYARIAPSLINTPEEIETTLREVRALAST